MVHSLVEVSASTYLHYTPTENKRSDLKISMLPIL